MAFFKKNISVLLAVILMLGAFGIVPAAAAGEAASVSYIDENGNAQTATATVLTGSETALSSGWYVVTGELNYMYDSNNELRSIDLSGDIKIILADGASVIFDALNVSDSEPGTLSIYGQSGNSGVLTANMIGAKTVNIYGGTVTSDNGITAGQVTITAGNVTTDYIWCMDEELGSEVAILGGSVTVRSNGLLSGAIASFNGSVAVTGGRVSCSTISGQSITLGWTELTDSIYAANYYTVSSDEITIVSGQTFVCDGQRYTGSIPGVKDDRSGWDYPDLNGKTLVPLPYYTVTWKNYDGTVIATDSVAEGDTAEYTGETPVKPDDGNRYYFSGWSPEPGAISGDTEYTAVYYNLPLYTVTWKDHDGTVLATDPVPEGEIPVYPGETPTREDDETYSYTFSHWSPTPSSDHGDIEYTAVYAKTRDVTYVDENGGEHTVTAVVLTGDEVQNYRQNGYDVNLNGDWYVVEGTVTYQNYLNVYLKFNAAANLIIEDGASLTVYGGFIGNNSLTIYGQQEDSGRISLASEEGTLDLCGTQLTVSGGINAGSLNVKKGTLTADNIYADYQLNVTGGALNVTGNTLNADIDRCTVKSTSISITGGTVNIATNSSADYALISNLSLNITGGVTNISGKAKTKLLTLGYTDTTDSITIGEIELDNSSADPYTKIEIVPGQILTCDGSDYYYGDIGDTPAQNAFINEVNGKTLRPLVEAVPAGYFRGHSISLSGDIGVNFYIALTDDEFAQGVRVDFEWMVNNKKKTASVTLTNADKTDSGYKAGCKVAAAEMTCDVKATLYIGGVEVEDNTYSVKRYTEKILNDELFKSKYIVAENKAGRNGEERYVQLCGLVIAMREYGAKAQIQFDRNTSNLANDGEDRFYYTDILIGSIDPESYIPNNDDMSAELSQFGLEYVGTSLVYLSGTTLRHYYRIADAGLFEGVNVTFGGESVTPVEYNGMIYFDKKEISAPDLDTVYHITFTKNGSSKSFAYSAIDYVCTAMRAPTFTTDMKILARATWYYNEFANEFFNI